MKKKVFLVVFLVIAVEAVVEAITPCITTPDCGPPPAPNCYFICAGSKCLRVCSKKSAASTFRSLKDCVLPPPDYFDKGCVNEMYAMGYHNEDKSTPQHNGILNDSKETKV